MADEHPLTEETIALLGQKFPSLQHDADESRIIGYDLSAPARVVKPVDAPLLNRVERRAGVGVDVLHWKAVTALWRNDHGDLAYDLATMQAPFETREVSKHLTPDERAAMEGDAQARTFAELLMAFKLQEERWLIERIIDMAAAWGGAAVETSGQEIAATLPALIGRVTSQSLVAPELLIMPPKMQQRVDAIAPTLPIQQIVSPGCPENTLLVLSLTIPFDLPPFQQYPWMSDEAPSYDRTTVWIEHNANYMGLPFAPTEPSPDYQYQVICDELVHLAFPAGVGILRIAA